MGNAHHSLPPAPLSQAGREQAELSDKVCQHCTSEVVYPLGEEGRKKAGSFLKYVQVGLSASGRSPPTTGCGTEVLKPDIDLSGPWYGKNQNVGQSRQPPTDVTEKTWDIGPAAVAVWGQRCSDFANVRHLLTEVA